MNARLATRNNFRQVTRSQQSHAGAVGGSTPDVQYAYATGASDGVFNSGVRPIRTIYPSGRILFFYYNTTDSLEDRLQIAKRLYETNGAGVMLVQYGHTGSGRAVVTSDWDPDLRLDLYGGTPGTYAGLDRFGRTIDHRWYDYTSGTVDRARYSYGYDYASNRTWKEDPVAAAASVNLDDLYAYDGLHRLTTADRGDLNGAKDAISTLTFAQDFGLDQLNNWSTFTEDDDGDTTLDLDQDRTHNDANEITDITETTGPSWTTPAHDAAGNLTSIPKPTTLSSAYSLTWDAWNRLVKVADGANTVAEYEYDGLNRRIVKSIYSGGSLDHTEHFYLSEENQVLEVRLDSDTTPHKQFTWGTRYVDDLVFRTRDTDANGILDETLYALQDANWNITALADTSGTITERFAYDPYGHSTTLDANFTPDADNTSDYDWEYRFTSRELDAETGLHYFRARYYHDGLGRFIGRDPLEYHDGMELYEAYFIPNLTDPMGRRVGGGGGARPGPVTRFPAHSPGGGGQFPSLPQYPLPFGPPNPAYPYGPNPGGGTQKCYMWNPCTNSWAQGTIIPAGSPSANPPSPQAYPMPMASPSRCVIITKPKTPEDCINRDKACRQAAQDELDECLADAKGDPDLEQDCEDQDRWRRKNCSKGLMKCLDNLPGSQ